MNELARHLERTLPLMAVLCLAAGCKADVAPTPISPDVPSQDGAQGGTAAPEEATEVRVGVLYWSMNIPGQVAMRKGLEAALPDINAARRAKRLPAIRLVPLVAGDGDEGIDRQIQQMGQLVKDNVSLIIVQPTDNAALSKGLQQANRAKIPVVAYDQHILGGDMASFVTSNNYQAGFLDGEYVAARFPDTTDLKVIVVEYPNVSSTVSRVDGFSDALEKSGQPFKVIKTYSAVEPVSGRIAGKAILKDFPEKGSVDVVFTVNDGGGLAVFDELQKAGRTEIFGATVDGDPKSVEIIRSGGMIKIDSAQFCGELGATSLRTADKILRGESVAQELLVPVFPITAETHHRYKGWLGGVPEAFDKPWTSSERRWSPSVVARTGATAK